MVGEISKFSSWSFEKFFKTPLPAVIEQLRKESDVLRTNIIALQERDDLRKYSSEEIIWRAQHPHNPNIDIRYSTHSTGCIRTALHRYDQVNRVSSSQGSQIVPGVNPKQRFFKGSRNLRSNTEERIHYEEINDTPTMEIQSDTGLAQELSSLIRGIQEPDRTKLTELMNKYKVRELKRSCHIDLKFNDFKMRLINQGNPEGIVLMYNEPHSESKLINNL